MLERKSAEFNTITGDDWRKGLIAARKRRKLRKAELKELIDKKLNEQK